MRVALGVLWGLSLSLCSSMVAAQTKYEDIKVGSVLTSGIELSSFVKPLPLPAGEWLVVSSHEDDVALRSNNTAMTKATPRLWLTLKNNRPDDSPLLAIVIAFTPEAHSVNWRNAYCESRNPKVLVDDFGTSPSSIVYLCAKAYSHTKFPEKLAKIAEGDSAWWKANLSALTPYASDFPDDMVSVDLGGNQNKGRNVWFSFFFKRDGDLASDAAYAQHVKDWMHTAGLSLQKVLDNSTTEFALPKKYAAAQ